MSAITKANECNNRSDICRKSWHRVSGFFQQNWPKISAFFHWFFLGGTPRLILFALMCGGAALLAVWVIIDVTNVRDKRAKRAVQKFNNLSQEDRTSQVSRVLSALLGQSGNIVNLRELTGLNQKVLEHIVSQLRSQGYLEVDGSAARYDIALTKAGKELFNQLHSGRKEERIYYMGDIFNVGNNSTVVNRSAIFDSLNSVGKDLDADSREVLQELTDLVLKSGSPVAAENLEGFLDELDKETPKKSVLNSLLNGIATALPSMLTAAELVENVRKIISLNNEEFR